MHNVPKWSDTLKNHAANAARFLNCVWPFWEIMHLRVKSDQENYVEKVMAVKSLKYLVKYD